MKAGVNLFKIYLAKTIEKQMKTDLAAIIEEHLQKSLTEGWRELRRSQLWEQLVAFHNIFAWGGFYRSTYASQIPSPAYSYAAQIIGHQFMRAALEHGLCLDAVFPGSFEHSREYQYGSGQIREFTFNAYQNGKKRYAITLRFLHYHDQFDFPESPTITLKAVRDDRDVVKKSVKKTS